MKNLVIIDASIIIHRIYFVVGGMWGALLSKSLLTIETVAQSILDADTYCVFDVGGSVYRKAKLPEYKGQRPKKPEEFYKVRNSLIGLLKGRMNIGYKIGVEADDIIAKIVNDNKDKYNNVYIFTIDKDMLQLVGGNVYVVNPYTREIMDRNAVFNKHGIYPSEVVLYLSLIGDAADNVPGVPGIGPKTAAKILKDYKTLEAVINSSLLCKEHEERIKLNHDLISLHPELLQNNTDIHYKNDN